MRKSVSNYLKTIYEASYTQTGTNNKQIATLLDVLPGSVTEAVSNLEKDGLVMRQKYHEITLTPAGYRLVKDLMYRYRLCEVWLAKTINLPLELIPNQAWLMSAIDSQDLIARLDKKLDQPKTSPFGGDLHLPEFDQMTTVAIQPLASVKAGQTIELVSYLETASTVKYLEHNAIKLQQQLKVMGQAQPISVITLADMANHEYMIDETVARYIYVRVLD